MSKPSIGRSPQPAKSRAPRIPSLDALVAKPHLIDRLTPAYRSGVALRLAVVLAALVPRDARSLVGTSMVAFARHLDARGWDRAARIDAARRSGRRRRA